MTEAETIQGLCRRWAAEAESESGARFPLWRVLATTGSEDNAVFEAWLLRRMREVNPGMFND